MQKSTILLTDNQEITDPKLVADTFNEYFANIWLKLSQMFLTLHWMTLGLHLWIVALFFYPITQREIGNEISLLKVGKATGPHSIPTDVMQILKSVI